MGTITISRMMGEKAKATGVTDVIVFLYPDNVPIGGADILPHSVTKGMMLAQELTTADFRAFEHDKR